MHREIATDVSGARLSIIGDTRSLYTQDLVMGISRTEINLRRLLAAAPQQQNQAKLIHYVATLREQLEQLTEERTIEGLPRVSKPKVNEYSEKIEAIAFKINGQSSNAQLSQEPFSSTSGKGGPSKTEEEDHMSHSPHSPQSPQSPHSPHSPGLRRRFVAASKFEDRYHDNKKADASGTVKLDAAAQTHIEKHRKLQEDLTDEMVVLAKQLKQSSLLMSQSIQNTEKILDSTEKAVEHSLASTGHVNTRAMDIYSNSFRTTCFTWIMIFVMTCIFVMVVLLIRVT